MPAGVVRTSGPAWHGTRANPEWQTAAVCTAECRPYRRGGTPPRDRRMSLGAVLVTLRARSDELTGTISGLNAEEWQRVTNCPPWRVHNLASHLVTSGRGFVTSVTGGLAGSVEPPARTGQDLGDAAPSDVARALSQVTGDFEALYDGLSETQLETICWHRR